MGYGVSFKKGETVSEADVIRLETHTLLGVFLSCDRHARKSAKRLEVSHLSISFMFSLPNTFHSL